MIIYDELRFGPGYFIIDDNKNFIKIGFNWNEEDEIEYYYFCGQHSASETLNFHSTNEQVNDFLMFFYKLSNFIKTNKALIKIDNINSDYILKIQKKELSQYLYCSFNSQDFFIIEKLYNYLDSIKLNFHR